MTQIWAADTLLEVSLQRESVNKEGNRFRFPSARLGDEAAKLVNSFNELNNEKDAALAYFIQAKVIILKRH